MLKIVAGVRGAMKKLTTLGEVKSNNQTNLVNTFATVNVAQVQEAALEEQCILVDEFDKPIGHASKRDCHTINVGKDILLHRAFSVFLFNQKGDLLLHKRSASKITFPGYYTNTCCSHPLMEIVGETDEREAIGVRRAARRRLNHELGIPTSEIELDDFFYVTRIHYQALGHDIWGEHEIDYVLFLQKNKVTLNPNPDEVSEIKWVPRDMINEFVRECNSPLSPWFKLILESKLPMWWDNLNNLEKVKDHNTIHRLM